MPNACSVNNSERVCVNLLQSCLTLSFMITNDLATFIHMNMRDDLCASDGDWALGILLYLLDLCYYHAHQLVLRCR